MGLFNALIEEGFATSGATAVRSEGNSGVLDSYLDQAGVTDESVRARAKSIAHIESSGGRNNTGPAVASGMHKGDRARGAWQIMPKTFAEVSPGGDITNDDQASMAGLQYFLQNVDRYGGDLDLATVAHHGGPGAADKYKTGTLGNLGDGQTKTIDYLNKIRRTSGQEPAQSPTAPAEERLLPLGGAWDMAAAQRQQISDASPITTSLKRGANQMVDSVANAIDVAAGNDDAIVKRMEQAQEYDKQTPSPTANKQWMEDWKDSKTSGWLGNISGFIGNSAEQLANSAPSMLGSIPGAIAGGSIGAAFGPVGVLVGGIIGGAVGSVPGSVATETGSRIQEMMGRDNVDANDPAAVKNWLSANRENILREGTIKGLTTAGMDGLVGGIGQRIVAGPMLRFAQKDVATLASMGVKTADKDALALARASMAYKTAMAVPAAELKSATTMAQNAMRGAAAFAGEVVGEGGGEYYGEKFAAGEGNLDEALLEALFAGGQAGVTTGASFAARGILGDKAGKAEEAKLAALAEYKPPVQQKKANSPLSNAALAGTATESASAFPAGASATNAAAELYAQRDALRAKIETLNDQKRQMQAGDPGIAAIDARLTELATESVRLMQSVKTMNAGAGNAPASTFGTPELDAQHQDIQQWLSDSANMDALRQKSPEMAREAMHVWNAVINNQTVALKTRIAALNQAHDALVGMPNFVMSSGAEAAGQAIPEQAGREVGPAKPVPPLEGQSRRVFSAFDNAPTSENKALPSPAEFDQATADYEAAYQDLVKAEQLGLNDQNLMAKQIAMRDAEARLQEITDAIASNRASNTAAKRGALLDDTLASLSPEQNPLRAFSTALSQAGFTDSQFTTAEKAKIEKWAALNSTFEDQEAGIEPSTPNEMDAGALGIKDATERPTVTDEALAEQKRKLRHAHIKDLVSKGFNRIVGNELTNPKTGHAEPLANNGEKLVARAAIKLQIDEAAHQAATSPLNDKPLPTKAQEEAGNYKKGKIVDFHGLLITIENPDGSTRSGTAPDGTEWSSTMHGHYGYLNGVTGADKDHLDAYIGPRPDLDTVFVVDQRDPSSGRYDEHKTMLGYPNIEAAQAGYMANFEPGWDGLLAITPMSMTGFKEWIAAKGPQSGSLVHWLDAKAESAKPDVEYSGIDAEETRTGLAVDSADYANLREWLADDTEPATGKKIHSAGRRLELETELENLDSAISQATEYLDALPARADDPNDSASKPEIAALGTPVTNIEQEEAPKTTDEGADKARALDAEYKRRMLDFSTNKRARGAFIRRLRTLASATDEGSSTAMILDGIATRLDMVTKAGTPDTLEFKQAVVDTSEAAPQVADIPNGDGITQDVPAAPAEKSTVDKAADALDAKINEVAARLAAKMKEKRGTLNSGVDPELLMLGAELGALYISKGMVKFAQYSKSIIDKMASLGIAADEVKPMLKEFYLASQAKVDDATFDQMDDARAVRGFDMNSLDMHDAVSSEPVSEQTIVNDLNVTYAPPINTTDSNNYVLPDPAEEGRKATIYEYDGIVSGFPSMLYKTGDTWNKDVNGTLTPLGSSADDRKMMDFIGRYPQEWIANGTVAVSREGKIAKSGGRIIEGTAPEHVGNVGKALEKDVTYDKTGQGAVTKRNYEYDEAINALIEEVAKVTSTPTKEITKDSESVQATLPFGIEIKEFKHTKTGAAQFSVVLPVRTTREEYVKLNATAIKHGGKYSKFRSAVAVPGFLFKTSEQANAFANDANVATIMALYVKAAAPAAETTANPESAPALYASTIPHADMLNEHQGMLDAPIYKRGQMFVGENGVQWTFVDDVAPDARAVALVKHWRDGRKLDALDGYSLQFVEEEMKAGEDWQTEQAKEAAKPKVEEMETVEPETSDAMYDALMAGRKAHFDYAGTDGRTLWIEKTSHGWTVKSQDDGSSGIITSGGGAAEWGKEYAASRATRDADYRFNEWPATIEKASSPVDHGLVDSVKRLQDLNVAQSAIDAAVSAYKAGDKSALNYLEQASDPADAEVDFDAMFDDVLAEETAPQAKKERKPRAVKAKDDGQQDELDSEMRSYEAKADGYPSQEMINEAIRLDVRNPGAMTRGVLENAIEAAKQRGKEDHAKIRARIDANNKAEQAHRLKMERDNLIQLANNAAQDRHVAERPSYEQRKTKAGLSRLIALKDEERAKRQGQIDDVDRRIEQLSKPSAPKASTRTASAATASAAKNVASGLGDAIAGLGKLFGGNGRLSSGLTFDEETYKQAKPLFQQAIAHFSAAGTDLKEAMRAVVRLVLDQFGAHAAGNMKPYVVRFMQDVKDGNLDYDADVINDKELGNDSGTEGEGSGPLVDVAPGEVGESGSDGYGGQSPDNSGDQRGTGNPGMDGAGGATGRSGGDSSAGVDSADAGNLGADPGDGGRSGTDGSGTPADIRGAGSTPPAAIIPEADFVIGSDVGLGSGGQMTKYRDNVAAIKLLKTLEAERRRATPAEQRTLARYVGWGGIPNAFKNIATGEVKEKWEAEVAELEALMTHRELRNAAASTRNAYFTAEPVVDFMWRAAARLGFNGGLVLEPSVGTGNFIGLMPEHLRGNTHVTGIELDSLTARIAGALYPQSNIIQSGFEKLPLPDDQFDMAIGNPPFGNPPFGKDSLRFPYKPALNNATIHNQFFRASLDAVRPGGLQIMVVTHYLLDAQDTSNRTALAKQARLLGAVRLPGSAFKGNALTEVVTDILFLQRLTPEEQELATAAFAMQGKKVPPKESEVDRRDRLQREAFLEEAQQWIETAEVKDPDGGEPMVVNSYFQTNPHMIAGELNRKGSMRKANDMGVQLRPGETLVQAMDSTMAFLPNGIRVHRTEEIDARTLEMHKALGESMSLYATGAEVGSIKFAADGSLENVIERIGTDGKTVITKIELTASTPWSPQLQMGTDGKWFREIAELDANGKKVKTGAKANRNVYVREVFETDQDVPNGLRMGEANFVRLKKLVTIRDLLVEQINLETNAAPEKEMEANRVKLRTAYEAFVAEHGFISEPKNAGVVSDMPDEGLVLSIENGFKREVTASKAARTGMKQAPASAKPAAILSRPVGIPPTRANHADTITDALAIAMSETGVLDLDRIQSLRGITTEEVEAELTVGESPLAFHDPEAGMMLVDKNAYLSGNVRRKLEAARNANLETNIKALEAIQPEAWTSDQVTAKLGSTWVPAPVYAQFIEHLLGGSATVKFFKTTNGFEVAADGGSAAATATWGTRRMPAPDLIEKLLNSRKIAVYDTDDEGGRHLNQAETDSAQEKRKEIIEAFDSWIFQDSDRRRTLTQLFNDTYNTRVNRQHDGSHMQFPGKIPDEIVSLRRGQINAIWRGVVERFVLYDHAVGAGKTFTGIARAMERRRMGLSKKPMVVVPNHLVKEWQIQTYRLYPGAKVLAASAQDLSTKNRRRMFAKIATGDWDLVIVPHSSFGFIGLSPETEERFLLKELQVAESGLKEAEEAAEPGRFKSLGVKEAEALIGKIQGRMDKVRLRGRDQLINFEQMGIDDLTVDESHTYKNLGYSSNLTDVRGMGNKSGSGQALDMYMKSKYLHESNGSIALMTGTPISNSAVEMYNILRTLAPGLLEEMGLEHFDAFRNQFVEATGKFEPTDSGSGLKMVTRLGRSWSNMRSLMDAYYSVADVVTNDDIKQWYAEDNDGAEFPLPKVKGEYRRAAAVKPTPEQQAALDVIIAGFDSLDGIEDVKERNKERLRLMDKARKVSLHAKAVDPSLSDSYGGKLDRSVQEITRLYKAWNDDKGTQLVFLDRGVPKSKGDAAIIKAYDALKAKADAAIAAGDEAAFRTANDALEKYDANEIESLRDAQTNPWNGYQHIKDGLIKSGIPANEIAFIQNYNSDADKEALFQAVRDGDIRVLIGSTPRMGAGTNVQERLVGLHHIDATWKPSDIEQREGRIIRQGNVLYDKYLGKFEVEILAYVTERTVDAKLWELNSMKLKMINAIRHYDGAFEMEFEDSDSVGMAEIAAIASGDPLLLERFKLIAEVESLYRAQRSFQRRKDAAQDALDAAKRSVEKGPARLEKLAAMTTAATSIINAMERDAGNRKLDMLGVEYSNAGQAKWVLAQEIKAQRGKDEKAPIEIEIDGKTYTSAGGAQEAITELLGDEEPFVAEVGGKQIIRRSDFARAIREAIGATFEANIRNQPVGAIAGIPVFVSTKRGDADSAYVELHGNMPLGDEGVSHGLSSDRDITPEKKKGTKYKGDDEVPVTVMGLRPIIEGFIKQLYAARNNRWESEDLTQRMKRAEQDIPALEKQLTEKFKHGDEYDAKKARLAAVEAELASRTTAVAPVADEPMLPGKYKVTDPDGNIKERVLSADDITQLLGHGYALERAKLKLATPVPEKAFFRSNGESVEYIASAKPVVIDVLPGALFFTYKNDRGYWYVVSADNGLALSNGYQKTRQEAIANADYRVTQVGADKILEQIAKVAKITDEQKAAAWADFNGFDAPAVLSRGASGSGVDHIAGSIDAPTADTILSGLLSRLGTSVNGVIVQSFKDLPAQVQEDARAQGSNESNTKGVYHNGSIYVVADNIQSSKDLEETVFHEVIGHYGMRKLLGPDFVQKTNALFMQLGGINGLSRLATKNGFGPVYAEYIQGVAAARGQNPERFTEAVAKLILTEEVFSHIAEHAPDLAARFKALIGRIRDWLRTHGYATLANYGETDILYLLSKARAGLRGPDGSGPNGGTNGTNGTHGRIPSVMRRSMPELAQDARQYLNDTFSGDTANTFNWWDRSVGSQFNKAKKDVHYRRVVNAAQSFLDDVAKFGTEAADMAPGLLPRMDTIASAYREAKNFIADGKDAEAIAAPIFDGTLFEDADGNKGKVWSNAELASKYKLTPKQIELYRQFRAAVDNSLEVMAIAEMNKVAQVNDLVSPEASLSMAELSDFYSSQFGGTLRDLQDKLERLKKDALGSKDAIWENAVHHGAGRKEYHALMSRIEAEQQAEQNTLMKEIESLQVIWDGIVGKKNTVLKLQREGYAPLMRFGKYTVDVVEMVPAMDEDGKQRVDKETGELMTEESRIFFSMFASEREAREAERIMKVEYPQAMVSRGVSSDDGYQLFGGVNPGTLELLAELAGKEDEIIQKYYREAISSRSAMKRLIHRQGIAGYSKDVTRSLASFLLSNARATASAMHFGEIMEAAADIPKSKGDVTTEAVKLINYIQNPNEEAGPLRGLLFMQFLGGSVAAAMVNLTQTVVTTLPYMHQFGGTAKELASAALTAARRMRGKTDGISADLAQALKQAEDAGIVAPHNIHALMGQTGIQGMTQNRFTRLFSHVWGSMFGMAEQYNRETAFIAAYNRAVTLGPEGLNEEYRKLAELNKGRGRQAPDRKLFQSPLAFAKNAVDETQFILGKAARPNWARGTVGATLFTFKSFSLAYLELLHRLPNKERAMMLGVLVVLSGLGGVPGADDLDDLIDTIGQAMGYATNGQKWKEQAMADAFGKVGGDFVMHGVSAFIPLNLASRLGFGNIVPGSGLLKKSNSGDHQKQLEEILGAAGGYFKQVTDAWDYTLQGRYGTAIGQAFAPKAFKDALKAIDMAQTGAYEDTKGRRVTDVTWLDAVIKAVGFQPTAVSSIQRIKGNEMQDIMLMRKVKATIAEIWALGMHNKNAEQQQAARDMIDEWNAKNPEMALNIKRSSILHRVKQMSSTAQQRMINSSPKELKAGVREAFSAE